MNVNQHSMFAILKLHFDNDLSTAEILLTVCARLRSKYLKFCN